jgi:hypothetical protein
MIRKCDKCKQPKSLDEFAWNNKAKSIKAYSCRPCMTIYAKNRYQLKKEEIKQKHRIYYNKVRLVAIKRTRDTELKKKFSITRDILNSMIDRCGNMCEICGASPTNGRGLAIDHNHSTGIVRGLLCFRCNSAIGQLKADVTTLNISNALEYIKRTEAIL